jgi:hypothetical protein
MSKRMQRGAGVNPIPRSQNRALATADFHRTGATGDSHGGVMRAAREAAFARLLTDPVSTP